MKIKNKMEAYAAYEKRQFGNKLLTWNSLEEMIDSEWSSKVAVRYQVPQSRYTAYGLTVTEAVDHVAHCVGDGANEKLFRFNEAAPDDKIIFQGELTRNHEGLILSWSPEHTMHRFAMRDPKLAVGLSAFSYLKAKCSPASYDDLMELLYLYEDSIVEFSVYEREIGWARGRNTVVWEVRDY
jgi:hypothetical protein